MKLFLQGCILIASFFTLWMGLRQLDWISILHIKEVTQSTEEKLGKLYWDIYSKIEKEETSKAITDPVDSLVYRIAKANGIDVDKLKIHVIRKDQINAFALPDHHLVLFTDLILDCENEDELCGVMAHELAHMEKGHIMKKLVKELGLSMLIAMTSGKGSPETIQYAVRLLSSTAYDRTLESEADNTAVDYLEQANINPEPFANFLFRMSTKDNGLPKQISWISTHPDSEERSKAILERMKGHNFEKNPVLDSIQWNTLLEDLKNE
jgi:predicted Zn-dependent protease